MSRQLVFVIGAAVALYLYSPEPVLSASTRCKQVQGNLAEFWNGSGLTGAITNGGILNGTTDLLFASDFIPTPDPTTFSNVSDFVITTSRGQLKASSVLLVDVGGVSGAQRYGYVYTEIARIDPDTSSGEFAGATGVLWVASTSSDDGITFESTIRGELCLARD